MRYTDEQIELFVLGQLPAKEQDQIKSALNSNPELRERVEIERSLMNSIRKLEKDEGVEASIKKASKSYFEEKKIKSLNKIRFIFIAMASAAAIIGFIVSNFLFNNDAIDGPNLFAENFEPAEMMEIDRSNNSNLDSLLNVFYRQYQLDNFDSAINILEQNRILGKADAKILHYAASAYLAKQPPEVNKAKESYLKIINQSENIYKPAAFWNLALVSLKENNTGQANKYLIQLTKLPDNKYTDRAKNLTRVLK